MPYVLTVRGNTIADLLAALHAWKDGPHRGGISADLIGQTLLTFHSKNHRFVIDSQLTGMDSSIYPDGLEEADSAIVIEMYQHDTDEEEECDPLTVNALITFLKQYKPETTFRLIAHRNKSQSYCDWTLVQVEQDKGFTIQRVRDDH